MVLAFVSGRFDMTFTSILVGPHHARTASSRRLTAVCEMLSTNTQGNLLVNREKPPFDDDRIRRVLSLSLDRKAFIEILSEGKSDMGGAMLPPPSRRLGHAAGNPRQTVPGYSPDVEKSRDEARRIMRGAGLRSRTSR